MTNSNLTVGIVGAAGYTGGELIRILLNHPKVTLAFAQSRSQAGKKVSSVHFDLMGETDLTFSENTDQPVDVLFLCLGHGESRHFLEENDIPDSCKIIDLANDFRLKADSKIKDRTFVYGLPELYKADIQSSSNVANPGCFATAIQLGLLPLAKAGLLNDVYTTGITGSTGAGQSLSPTSHFSWRANNIQAYKTLTHQHLGEIKESLQFIHPKNAVPNINFVPWRGDFPKGIFISSQLHCDLSPVEMNTLFTSFYADQPFVHISKEPIFMKQVINTNKALIQIENNGDQWVIHSVLDNLIKGASGQAVQNMNLMFGFDQTLGLNLKSIGY